MQQLQHALDDSYLKIRSLETELHEEKSKAMEAMQEVQALQV